MSGVTWTIEPQLGEARAAIAALRRLGAEPAPLLRSIGTGLVRNTQDRIDRGVDPEGRRFAALHPDYAPMKKGPGILRESGLRGGLQGSITFRAEGEEVAVGTNKEYGAIHQFGGIIRPRRTGGFLVFRLASGRVFARQVTIPARPYLGLSAADEQTILDAAEEQFDRALARAAIAGRRALGQLG